MFLRIKPHITLLAVILFSGCAYYNTFYNAQEYYNEAEKLRLEKDGESITDIDKVVGGWSSKKNREELFELINVYDNDRFIPQKQKIEIVEGDILKTVPKFYKKNKNIKIRLLHLDADLYEPTLVGLKYFWDLLIPGGVLLLDEYAFDGFIGESVAVDEFFKKNKIVPNFQKIKTSDNPGAFLIKKIY